MHSLRERLTSMRTLPMPCSRPHARASFMRSPRSGACSCWMSGRACDSTMSTNSDLMLQADCSGHTPALQPAASQPAPCGPAQWRMPQQQCMQSTCIHALSLLSCEPAAISTLQHLLACCSTARSSRSYNLAACSPPTPAARRVLTLPAVGSLAKAITTPCAGTQLDCMVS